MKGYLKIIAGILATIILGAIGSGLWERVLSPGFDKLQYFVVNKISFFYTGYLDSIYEEAAKSLSTCNGSSFILIIYFVGLAILFFTLKYSKSEITVIQHLQASLNRMPTFQGLLASAMLLVMTFYFGIQKNYVNDIRLYSHKSMEILRPYVSENDYYLMKSEYFQVKTEEDFKKFNLKIINHASKNNVSLPVSVISK